MPSYRVTDESLSLQMFDAVGSDGHIPSFVRHVGLVAVSGSSSASRVAVLDMGPPLHGPSSRGAMSVQVVGGIELTDDEIQKLKVFVDRHESEHKLPLSFDALPQIYCIHPHVSPLYESDGRYARVRFSCAGFVIEAYRSARIQLLDFENLPSVDLAMLRTAYAREIQLAERGVIGLHDLGLDGDGPWPVVLCGYVFHAFNRDPDIVRHEAYVPTAEDCYFP